MKNVRYIIAFYFIIYFVGSIGCKQTAPVSTMSIEDSVYIQNIKSWQQGRYESLKKSDGWLSLAGLLWLSNGENTFGSDTSNALRLDNPHTPDFVGSFTLLQDSILFTATDSVEVFMGDSLVNQVTMIPDSSDDPTILTHGSLIWYIVKRQDRYGVRIKDTQNPDIGKLEPLEYFTIDTNYRIHATFVAERSRVEIATISGGANEMESPGKIEFTVQGHSLSLIVLEGGSDSYFILFGDRTNGNDTYGAGRYIYIPKADQQNHTIIDFNKAYSPPCAFTDFATCPMPPEGNRLPIAIESGEKYKAH